MDKIIAVLRHADYHQPADVPSALLPYALTPAGEAQAAAAAESVRIFCAEHNLRLAPVIDASRLRRAWQTAQIMATCLAPLLGYAPTVAEYAELAERSVGAAANLTVSEIEAILRDDPRYGAPPPGWKSDAFYRLPLVGAESLMEAGARVAGHLTQALRQCRPGELKIVVGHGASIRHAAVHLGILPLAGVTGVSMFHARPVYLTCRGHQWWHLAGDWKMRDGHKGAAEKSGEETRGASDEYGAPRLPDGDD
ncbi:MAG: histidine phosphatase family protein [Pseudomonadota bacterium]